MESGGLPTTISVSMALHVAGLGAWLYMSQMSKENQTKVLSNVELMVAVRPTAERAVATPPSTWNFLKMALPTAPARGPLDVEAPKERVRHTVASERMLEQNQSKLQKRLELESERNLDHHSLSALDAADRATHVSRTKLADVARLEEVGSRRASKAAIAMDDALVESHSSRGTRPMDMSDMAAAAAPAHSHGAAPMATLSDEAAPVHRGGGGGSLDSLASLLPSESVSSHGRTGPMGAGGDMEAAPAPARHHAEEIVEKKKASMIEGPLKHRRVVHYEIPKFPSWAQAQGVQEAIVRIRFTVSPSGDVLEEMRLVQTSGYGELDRLAMKSLSHWQFQEISEGSGNQWGIITFRFVME